MTRKRRTRTGRGFRRAINVLKRLASAVQLRPWPPLTFQKNYWVLRDLGCFRAPSTAQGSARDTLLDRLREQVGFISERKCQELCPEVRSSILGWTAHTGMVVLTSSRRRMPCIVLDHTSASQRRSRTGCNSRSIYSQARRDFVLPSRYLAAPLSWAGRRWFRMRTGPPFWLQSCRSKISSSGRRRRKRRFPYSSADFPFRSRTRSERGSETHCLKK
jgi:hypothetical protein